MGKCHGGGVTFGAGHFKSSCAARAVIDSMFCEPHRLAALARVAAVRSDRPKPWSGVLKGSAIGRRRFQGTV